MKLFFVVFCLFTFGNQITFAQDKAAAAKEETKSPSASSENQKLPNVIFQPDKTVETNHTVTVKGQRVNYKAITGTLPVWDNDGNCIAGLYFTYYQRTDVKTGENRPLVISFNGGPGSASVWMHIGYTGPRLLKIDDEGYPVQPYGIIENPNSILDVADIVYVNPVNTGFSRMVNNKIDRKQFFGVRADVKYLATWLETFVTRYNRWASPKYLIGESYGTTRVSGLALELQSAHWMYLNGVILVSPTELGIERQGPVEAALRLPYYAATAWYHKKLPAALQQKDLLDVLPEVENFTMQKLLPGLAKGSSLPAAEKKELLETFAKYSGLSTQAVMQYNGDVPVNFFWKELLRDQNFTVGRLDSRYKGVDKMPAGDGPDFNAELTSWSHSFTPAINIYLRNELNYKTDLEYKMFGDVHPWDRSGDRTGESLRQAMAQNPYLHVMVQSGYYDGACDYFNAKYNMWQMDPSGNLTDRLTWKGYRSGHMMYLRKQDLSVSNEDIREFIKASIPAANFPAKY